jgi:threonine-phosphate decarboxylase
MHSMTENALYSYNILIRKIDDIIAGQVSRRRNNAFEEIVLKKNRGVDASAGINPLGPSKKVKAAIRKAVKDIGLFPEAESEKLKRLFSSKYGPREECILFGNSIDELIYLIPSVFMPGRVLIIGPALRIYEQAVSVTGAEISYVVPDEHSGFSPDMETIKEKMKNVDLVFIADPNRISGRLSERAQLSELISYAASKGVRIVIDESLIEFTGEKGLIGGIDGWDNLIILRTTAYFYALPGLEISCAVAPPAVIAGLRKKRRPGLNTLALEAAGTACKDKTYQKLTGRHLDVEKNFIRNTLKRFEGLKIYDSDSNLLLFRSSCPGRNIVNTLARAGFSFRHCEDIQGLNSNFLRFSVMKHEHNKKFIRILVDCLERIVAE